MLLDKEGNYYIYIDNNELINGYGEIRLISENTLNYEVTQELYNDFIENPDKYMWNGKDVVPNPDYEEIEKQKERQRLDALTLTPADVERALYKAKKMDFEDLKALIVQALPTVDIKALSIEFRARDFYRGATANGMRLFDVVGQLLGYTSDDMDYLFEHKELPIKE